MRHKQLNKESELKGDLHSHKSREEVRRDSEDSESELAVEKEEGGMKFSKELYSSRRCRRRAQEGEVPI